MTFLPVGEPGANESGVPDAEPLALLFAAGVNQVLHDRVIEPIVDVELPGTV